MVPGGLVRAGGTPKDNPEALLVFSKDRDRIVDMLKIRSKYADAKYYVWKDSKPGSVDGVTSRLQKDYYSLGNYKGSPGDPYTYDKVSGSLYRVISGPKSSPIGKTFRPKTTPKPLKVPEEESRDVAQLGAPAPKSTPSKRSGPRRYKATREEVIAFGEMVANSSETTSIHRSQISAVLSQLRNNPGSTNKDRALETIYKLATPEQRKKL